MLHAAILCLLIGQVPPPPVPLDKLPPNADADHVPPPLAAPADQIPADPAAQRQWLLDRLLADLRAQGKLDAQKQQEVQQMVNATTDNQIGRAVQVYQQQLAEAQANLRSLQAYRDYLRQEVARRQRVYQQEQAIAAYGSALAAQQAMPGYYASKYYISRWGVYHYGPYPRSWHP